MIELRCCCCVHESLLAITSLAAMQRYFRSWTISGHCADCREACGCNFVTPRFSAAARVAAPGSLAKLTAIRRASSLG